jgi:hypothetical protein
LFMGSPTLNSGVPQKKNEFFNSVPPKKKNFFFFIAST